MHMIKTDFEGLFIIQPNVFCDERGCFFESYNKSWFKDIPSLDINWVQDNQSTSYFGVIRGLHMQKAPKAQNKLVRVLQGEILDVAIDMRKSSKSFIKVFSIILSSENKKQLFIPKGFLHGFSVLSSSAEVLYKVDDFYDKDLESGVIYNDSSLNINWNIPLNERIISKKDLLLPPLIHATYF
jgi:dTDP-4-dehydrorhamnose 3,5-epimerase